MKNDRIDISIIIPAKDEAMRLPAFLHEVISFCKSRPYACEIIIVDDGSKDDTSAVANSYKKDFSCLKVITFKKNRGKSHAVKCGMIRSRGEIALFLDADGAVHPCAIEENLHFFDQGYDVVIGSRVLKDQTHEVKGKWYRVLIGKVFNFFVQSLLFKEIQDTQCGFKMFRKQIVKPIFSRLQIQGFGFDIELLFLAYKMGLKIKEVPVNWEDQKGSKINLITDSICMFINIWQVRYWHFTPVNMRDKYMTVQQLEYMNNLEHYHWWFQSKAELVRHFFKTIIDPSKKKILDAGCGTGQNLSYLKPYGECYGCDVVPQAIGFCMKNGLKNLVLCNVENLSFHDKTFDIITALDVIEHVEDPDKVLDEFHRILKDDGKAIITVPAFKFLWSQHDDALCHLRRYEKKEFEDSLSNTGFRIETLGYFYFSSFLAVAFFRAIKRFFHKGKKSKSDITTLPPKILNDLLKGIFKIEIKILSIFPLPFGTTLYAVVSKQSQDI